MSVKRWYYSIDQRAFVDEDGDECVASAVVNARDFDALVQKIMARLADMLGDDNFNNIEAMVLDAGVPYPPLLSAPTPSTSTKENDRER